MVLATVLSHSAHCLCLSDKLSILTDELCSYLKVQTVSKQQMFGNAVFVNDLLTSRLLYGQLKVLFLCRSLLRADAEKGDTAQSLRSQPGAVLETSSKLMKATFFFYFIFKSLGLSVCTGYEKSRQKGLKVAKYSAKVTLVTRELMAEGS